jgi:hypothetical protein
VSSIIIIAFNILLKRVMLHLRKSLTKIIYGLSRCTVARKVWSDFHALNPNRTNRFAPRQSVRVFVTEQSVDLGLLPFRGRIWMGKRFASGDRSEQKIGRPDRSLACPLLGHYSCTLQPTTTRSATLKPTTIKASYAEAHHHPGTKNIHACFYYKMIWKTPDFPRCCIPYLFL